MSTTKRIPQPKTTFRYNPRDQFAEFHRRATRWALLRCHRRAGKSYACVNDIVLRALYTTKENARYAYIAPYRQQAKQIAWRYLQEAVEGIAIEVRESDLSVKLPNGAVIGLYGSDNPNALRGVYHDGVICDESQDIRPSLLPEVVFPTLTDRKGWLVLCGTPKGRNNQFFEYYQRAIKDQNWFHLTLKASQSRILPEEELDLIRNQMEESQYEQEFECSFDAALPGTFYTNKMNELQVEGHLNDNILYDDTRPVIVSADIGRTDSTVLWFAQEYPHHFNIIDCEEAHGEDLDYYFTLLKTKPYQYEKIWLPHDARPKTLATKRSTLEQFLDEKFPVQIVPQLKVQHGIDAVRKILPYCRFNQTKCQIGIEALRCYRREYDDINRVYRDTPKHDWTSDFADSFRYLALVLAKRPMTPPKPRHTQQQALGQPQPAYSLDQLYTDRQARGSKISKMRI